MSQENESIKTDNRTWADLWPVFWDPAVTPEAVAALYLDTIVRLTQADHQQQVDEIQDLIAPSDKQVIFSSGSWKKSGEVVFQAKDRLGMSVSEGSLEVVLDEVNQKSREVRVYPVMDKHRLPAKEAVKNPKKGTAIPSAVAFNEFNGYENPEILAESLFDQVAAEGREDLLEDLVDSNGVYERPTGARTLQMALGRVKPVSRQGTRQAHFAVPRRRSGAD